MGDVFFGDNVKIYLDKTSGASSSFSAADEIQTSIFNFDKSGGEFDSETKPLLGNANIQIQKPQTEVEVSFDVAIKTDAPTSWDEIFYGAGLTSATRGGPVSIGIVASDGTIQYQILYNNISAVSFDKKLEAGNYLEGTLKLKLAPTDSSGNANVKIGDDTTPVITITA